jgi:hypothetical protein
MPLEKVSWKTEKDGVVHAGEFEVEIPETLADFAAHYGEETTRLGAKKSVIIYLQAWARRESTKEEKPMTPAEIAAAAPSLRVTFSEREAVDPVEKVLAQFGKLTEEKRASLLASLSEMMA